MTTVPASVQDQVGAGTVNSADFIPASEIPAASSANAGYFATVNGKALTSAGKPEILYIGAEYCPFCGAQRWAMIVSLSRFGTFSGLKTATRSSSDTDPNTPTWSFYGSKYTSPYINFTSVEETTNERQGNSSNTSVPYVTLQKPTSAQQALLNQYDPGANGYSGAIPFIDMGNKIRRGRQHVPVRSYRHRRQELEPDRRALTQPNSAIAKGVLGSANYMTAGICKLTNNQPASACTPAIQALESKFAS